MNIDTFTKTLSAGCVNESYLHLSSFTFRFNAIDEVDIVAWSDICWRMAEGPASSPFHPVAHRTSRRDSNASQRQPPPSLLRPPVPPISNPANLIVCQHFLCSRSNSSSKTCPHRYFQLIYFYSHMISKSIETELESLRIQLNKANYDLSNARTEAERTKLRFEDMLRDRDTQIIIEQKKSDDLQKDRKFLFEKQQSQATELLTLQDGYANYKVSPRP